MLGRIIFTLKNMVTQRKGFRALLSGEHQIRTWLAITPDLLQQRSVRCLVLDFDGVLAGHGAVAMEDEASHWLAGLMASWPYPVVLLSNKPFGQRVAWMKRHHPQVAVISGVPKKPYPQGLVAIAQQHHIAPHEVLLVDDRLLTGMLAALLAGTQALWWVAPRHRWCSAFFRECFFQSLRWLEQGVVRLLLLV